MHYAPIAHRVHMHVVHVHEYTYTCVLTGIQTSTYHVRAYYVLTMAGSHCAVALAQPAAAGAIARAADCGRAAMAGGPAAAARTGWVSRLRLDVE